MQLAPAPPARPMPAFTLAVPDAIHAAFDDARARAVRDTSEWLAAHPQGTALEFRSFITDKAGAPPTGAAAEADHAIVKAAVDSRRPAQDAQALWIDEYGLFPPWQPAIDAYVAKTGPEQAKAGLALLAKAKDLTGVLTFPIKDRHMRERPFQEHADTPLLAGITHVHGGSFPSGHASLAFAQEAMLSAMLPERAAEFRALAEQISFSRPYAAAHYPSDVVTGAYVGAAAAAFVQARPDAEIPARYPH
jgi:hypothetical protein